jgi:hypothetical protein
MLAALIGSLYQILAMFHNVPNDAVASFLDGDDSDLPVFLD